MPQVISAGCDLQCHWGSCRKYWRSNSAPGGDNKPDSEHLGYFLDCLNSFIFLLGFISICYLEKWIPKNGSLIWKHVGKHQAP